jgi:hypothetical protein
LKLIVAAMIVVPSTEKLQIEGVIYYPDFLSKVFTEKVKAIIKVIAERRSADTCNSMEEDWVFVSEDTNRA